MEVKKTLAIGYTRISSNNQKAESLISQRLIIDRYAETKSIEIIRHFEDNGVSGTSLKGRDGFMEMIEFCEDNPEVRFVISHRLDRFSRDMETYLHFKKKLKSMGITLIFVEDNLKTSDETLVIESIRAAMAEEYSIKLSKEVKRGLHYNALNCQFTGGKPPLGFNVNPVTKKLEICEDEAEIIHLIFKRYGEDGYSYSEIIEELNRLGYKTKAGNNFKKTSLYELFKNEKYRGIYFFNKRSSKFHDSINTKRNNHAYKHDDEIVRIPDGCPRIIEDELWQKVQDRMDKNKSITHRYSKEHYLLKGKIFCGDCGSLMVGNRRCQSGRNKQLYVTYACQGRKNKNGCGMKEINKEYIEKFVIKQIRFFFFRKKRAEQLAEDMNNYLISNQRSLQAEISVTKKKLNGINHKINNIILSIENGFPQDVFQDRLVEFKKTKDGLTEKISSLQLSLGSPKYTAKSIKQALKNFNTLASSDSKLMRKIISEYVEKVVVHKDYVEVIMNVAKEISDKYAA